jgi:hypothetical protein
VRRALYSWQQIEEVLAAPAETCQKCGAQKYEKPLGLEEPLEECRPMWAWKKALPQ